MVDNFRPQIVNLRRLAMVLTLATIFSVVSMVGIFAVVEHYSAFDREYAARSDAIRVLTQSIAKNAAEAAKADIGAYDQLATDQAALASHVEILREGSSDTDGTGLPPTDSLSTEAARAMDELNGLWEQLYSDVAFLLSQRKQVALNDNLAEKYRGGTFQSELQGQAQLMHEWFLESNAPNTVLAAVEDLSDSANLLSRNLSDMALKLNTGKGAVIAEVRLRQSISETAGSLVKLRDVIQENGMLDSLISAQLENMSRSYMALSDDAQVILERTGVLLIVHYYRTDIFNASNKLYQASERLASVYQNVAEMREPQQTWGYTAAVVAFLLLLIRGLVARRIARLTLLSKAREAQLAEEKHQRDQAAILSLLDEIAGLGEGDLTVNATVGEEVTGAIADAFNEAIEEIRQLVASINQTSAQVSGAVRDTRSTALQLAEASKVQAHQITAASKATSEMADSVKQVSRNAQESAAVAQHSAELATHGAERVRHTVYSMESISEQILETSKTINRLSNSSEEIGEIVKLIASVSDQTNVLAINAAIQASMAGESGRGFEVVADEVHRLAERSNGATKQIEILVRTIQADISELVKAMAKSTVGISQGTELANDAGNVLKEIESVSGHLANLIKYISGASAQQARAAISISDSMKVIQGISSRTSEGTNETAISISELANLATRLRKSVAGFKLPGQGTLLPRKQIMSAPRIDKLPELETLEGVGQTS
ncbi:hypothetical protein BTA51_03475 [Hahella sp. CCB-MM4]|uniref:methyl-accepting chemotaxis protein n=1 Tax=Hahella sp. (strain CCB-MM4) TaxID=1926491 RepID=UPI000B9AFA5A|nr:methyl-accepting chemotaxis protein [Hahella sp. CCB-MM4]OZG75445.1 hypothetical protein BTA51_03475 [Hahella sp. CCB-MM4]